MPKTDPAKLWSLNYRLLMSVISSVAPDIAALGLENKELVFLADTLWMPKPTVTVNLKRLEAAGLLRREIDTADLRRHRLLLTPDGRKAMSRGLTLLSDAFGARLGRLSAAQQASLRTLLEKMN